MQAHADVLLPARKLGCGAAEPSIPWGQVMPGPHAKFWASLQAGWVGRWLQWQKQSFQGGLSPSSYFCLVHSHVKKSTPPVSSMWLHSGAQIIAKYKPTSFARP
eukprot:scaffold76204_cov20-Tisochrysis_lutea.AAC.2